MTTFLTRMMEREKTTPDYMLRSFKEVPGLLRTLESQ